MARNPDYLVADTIDEVRDLAKELRDWPMMRDHVDLLGHVLSRYWAADEDEPVFTREINRDIFKGGGGRRGKMGAKSVASFTKHVREKSAPDLWEAGNEQAAVLMTTAADLIDGLRSGRIANLEDHRRMWQEQARREKAALARRRR